MKKSIWIVTVCLFFNMGCLGKMTGNIAALNTDQPILKTIDPEHKTALLAMGEEEDRKQEQSNGLGLIRNDSFEKYANEVLTRLKAASGVKDIPGRVYLKAVNAWSAKATASGNIYVPLGILGDIYSEDVFAALLAHELSHVIQNHADADFIVKVTKKSVYISSLTNDLSGKSVLDSDAFRGAVGTFAASEIFLTPFWSRNQDVEADCLGLDILVNAGYSPNAMEELLIILEVLDERNRIEREKKLTMIKMASQKVKNDAIRNFDFDTCLKSIFSDATGAVGEGLRTLIETHGHAGDRIDELRTYKKKYYRQEPRKKYEIKKWQAAINTEEMKQSVRGVEHAFLANQHLINRELDKAIAIIRQAVTPSTKKESYIRTVFADIRKAQGNTGYSLKNHEIALRGKYPAFDSYKEVLISKINNSKEQNTKNKVFVELLSVFEDYGKPPQYYKELVSYAEKLDLKSQATALEIECMAKYAGDGVSCSQHQSISDDNLSAESLLKVFKM